jgi:hypothetical protein
MRFLHRLKGVTMTDREGRIQEIYLILAKRLKTLRNIKEWQK